MRYTTGTDSEIEREREMRIYKRNRDVPKRGERERESKEEDIHKAHNYKHRI